MAARPPALRAQALSSFAACWLVAQLAAAQVVEPNGLAVPVEPAPEGERSVQSYFDELSPPEPIDAVADASAEPSTFSPLCGFEAELVLSESQSPAGLAWYNVPSEPNAAPAALYPVLAETTETGATISSSAIREHPDYAGGLIGFALTKFGGQPVYYSEAARNALCTACPTPGHWTLMLAYPSALEATTYYLAWEDWEGANESTWPNDGDFNDKLFRVKGVRCAGGGEPCETGLHGVCARGLTECGEEQRTCKQVTPAVEELCDAFDNDCDGRTDEEAPCPGNRICRRGTCTSGCGGEEFPCAEHEVCDQGRCVERGCEGVPCGPGTACRAGECVQPCDGVVCPIGHTCVSGACLDPCAGVRCDAGGVCREGACVEACNCAGCPNDLRCDARSGLCVDPGCEGRACPDGQRCLAGECVDPCRDARCPGGEACVNGACPGGPELVPVDPRPSDGGSSAGSAGSTGTQGNPARAGSGVPERTRDGTAASTCNCNALGSPAKRSPLALVLAAAGCVYLRRRSRRSAPSSRHA